MKLSVSMSHAATQQNEQDEQDEQEQSWSHQAYLSGFDRQVVEEETEEDNGN